MPDESYIRKESIIMATKKNLDTLTEAAVKASQTVKEAAEKAAPAVKAAGQTASKAIRETGKKAADAGKKAVSALIPEIYLQWQGKELSYTELVERVKADYRAQSNCPILSCRIYVKPEEGAAYYVVNDAEGKIAL
jgi:hypothetical protein